MKNILMNVEMTKAILDGRKVQTRRVVDCNSYKEMTLDSLAGLCGYFNIERSYGCDHKECGEVDEDGKGRCFTWSCPLAICGYEDEETSEEYSSFDGDNYVYLPKPKYQIGETIWVREPVKVKQFNIIKIDFEYLADGKIVNDFQYPAKFYGRKWLENCQGIPNGCIKEMARIFLKITNVRVERLQDIQDEECIKEGIKGEQTGYDSYITYYNKPDYETFSNIFSDNTPNNEFLSLEKLAFQHLWNSTAKDGYKWSDNPYVFVYEFERVEG